MTTSYHDPVLLRESVDALAVKSDGVYVDATMGGGGHAREILQRLGKKGTLFGFDRDEEAGRNVPDDKRFLWIRHNYRYMKRFLRFYDKLSADGILADLGVSSHQFDVAERGFSTRFDGPLDMRMNREEALTAAEVVNRYDEDRLISVFREYGEIRNARELTRRIVSARKEKAIRTTSELREVLAPCAERGNEAQFYARVFQALRIEVNDELGGLKDLLMQALDVLSPGGRLVVITYHSLEDRIVKHFMIHGNFEGESQKDVFGNTEAAPLKPVFRKPVDPSEEEIARNPRARSAKMRVAEKV